MEGTPQPVRPSILLADDDDRFRTMLRSLLEEDGYTVVAEAANASATTELARLHQPEVVVLDLVMRGSRGLSTARELLAEDPARPVVVLSSLFDPSIEQEAVRMGAWYLEKVEGVEALEHLITDAVSVTRRR